MSLLFKRHMTSANHRTNQHAIFSRCQRRCSPGCIIGVTTTSASLSRMGASGRWLDSGQCAMRAFARVFHCRSRSSRLASGAASRAGVDAGASGNLGRELKHERYRDNKQQPQREAENGN